ncbi:Gfo/Idh/MocA family protein [Pedobacter cryophilus]|uniref:Gfo/Idh/MocA family oxidoreductase n=1 Tax=Pedobacter cryophilus TaxID=2571271 RepID=A0A4U1C424_9SPHI|nr:Gfo/Idh/MocA family oxidoreductase [Pedobacter cryophilus]TKB99106.1 gfo/Idh/MocA family oxidoreductase [Pedobacter cryophilus]
MNLNRRKFIKTASIASLGIYLSPLLANAKPALGKRIGIIGLDTSHSLAFTKLLFESAANEFDAYKVVAAYPYGSKDLELSKQRIPIQTEEIQKYNVEIVDSIAALLQKVDVVLLETNDGRLHLEQALEVIKAKKTLFIDKPMAASLADAVKIFKAAEAYQVPVFSSSSLRYVEAVRAVKAGKFGKVIGAETYSPATIEKTHPDLFWYGIHGVETLFAVMGANCQTVTRFYSADTDEVVGTWDDGRIGTFRGLRKGKTDFGGTAFCEKSIVNLGPYLGYQPLLKEIIQFFKTGVSPVSADETLAILAFMEAADESKRKNGKAVKIASIMKKSGL